MSIVTNVRAWLDSRGDEMVEALREAVELESPSDDPPSLHRFAAWIERRAARIPGASTTLLPDEAGPIVRIAFESAGGATGDSRPALVLAHFDTVWSVGTLAAMPCRLEDGRLHGPGAFDMKGGLVQALYALEALAAAGARASAVLLCTSDEETGSRRSEEVIKREAQASRAVLVVEPAMGEAGVLKVWRKGVGQYQLRVLGRAAHAGGDHAAGRNAIAELARHVLTLESLTDYGRGTTVNVGVVSGGTRSNVVPAEATAEVDFRVMTLEEADRLDEAVRAIGPTAEGFRVELTGGLNRPPLPEEQTRELFARAKALAAEMGVTLEGDGSGGGSDGNFTAALGIPTLDGLGAVGDGAHAAHEHVLVDRMPERAALLAGLIAAE